MTDSDYQGYGEPCEHQRPDYRQCPHCMGTGTASQKPYHSKSEMRRIEHMKEHAKSSHNPRECSLIACALCNPGVFLPPHKPDGPAREWWLHHRSLKLVAFGTKQDDNGFHVIEYSALEKMQQCFAVEQDKRLAIAKELAELKAPVPADHISPYAKLLAKFEAAKTRIAILESEIERLKNG